MLQKQLSLFSSDDELEKKCFFTNIDSAGIPFENINIGDITFKDGQNTPIHRWYRLTPSYSPSLVEYFIKEFKINKTELVLDPFSGRGTTVIECQRYGLNSIGIEINPLLQKVGEFSLIWEKIDQEYFKNYLTKFKNLILKYKKKDLNNTIEDVNTSLPIIHNVFRWWKEDVLKDLLIARELSRKNEFTKIFPYLWLAINKSCIDCANIHRNHPTITFDDDHNRLIDVFADITQKLNNIKEDLNSLSENEFEYSQKNHIVLGDSTSKLNGFISQPINFVITSPPYPNRFSYVHQTRPQLHFMELLDDIKQATEIDLSTIGGTWGRATSILQKEIIKPPKDITKILCYYDTLKDKSTLMCNYATKYFLDMRKHIKSLKKVVDSNFRGAYVVGNSRLSGVEIFTETILSQLFELEGFKVDKIVSFRKRGGRQRLYETAVCIRR